MRGADRWTWGALAVVLIAALLVRLDLAGTNHYPSVDGVHYQEQARGLLRDGALPYSSFPPGWPLLIALPLLGRGEPAALTLVDTAHTLNAVFGALLPALAFVAFRRRLPATWSLAGAILLAILPMNLVLSKGDLSEMSYACVLLAAWLATERRPGWAGGLLLGYAYLIRPEAALVAAGVWIAHAIRERRVPWGFTAGAAISVLPYLLFLRVQSGHWSLSAKGVFLQRAVEDRSALQWLGLVGENLRTFGAMLPDLIGWPLVLLAAAGLWIGRGRWLLFLLPLLTVPWFDFGMRARFWAPYLPLVLLSAGLAAGRLLPVLCKGSDRWLSGWLEGAPNVRTRGTHLAAAVALLAGFGLAAAPDYGTVGRNTEGYRGLRDAGRWLSERVDPETIVASYKPYASFWAGCGFLPFPKADSDPAVIIEYCRRHGAKYLIANVHVIHRFRPGLDPLLGSPLPAGLREKLTLVKLLQYDQTVQNTVIYRIEGPMPAKRPKR